MKKKIEPLNIQITDPWQNEVLVDAIYYLEAKINELIMVVNELLNTKKANS